MTWREFKAAVERAGVKDDDPISWIEVTYPQGDVRAVFRAEEGWEIEED